MKKRTICTLMATVLCLSTGMTAFAAPETMPDGGVFDAEYYAENNPDVVAVFGTDKNALYSHYVNFGRAEGRAALNPADIANVTVEISDGTFNFNIATQTITSLTQPEKRIKKLVIPSTIGGYAVKNIGAGLLKWREDITDVTISNGIVNIGELAFSQCSNLSKVTIPNSVKSIGDKAFYACSSLVDIRIPDNVISIGNSAFNACYELTEVVLPNSVTSIGDDAFGFCGHLSKITIPNSITNIGDCAFRSTDITEVILPNSIRNIPNSAFARCDKLTKVIIPDGIVSIDIFAFGECESLTEVVIPKSVTSIYYNAFYGFKGVIYTTKGSFVEQWAREKGYSVITQ